MSSTGNKGFIKVSRFRRHFTTILIILLYTIISIFGFLFLWQYSENVDLKNQMAVYNTSLESFKMYYWSRYNKTFHHNASTMINGLAYGDYIVVWTKDRNIIDVLETCTHEYAHNNLEMKD